VDNAYDEGSFERDADHGFEDVYALFVIAPKAAPAFHRSSVIVANVELLSSMFIADIQTPV
jgi:hypothetical protein